MKMRFALAMVALTAAQSAWSQDIVIGQSVPLSGSNADIGRDMRDGALAIFARLNAGNAFGGRRVKLVTLDNANNRQREPSAKLLVSIGRLMGLDIDSFGNIDPSSGPLAGIGG